MCIRDRYAVANRELLDLAMSGQAVVTATPELAVSGKKAVAAA